MNARNIRLSLAVITLGGAAAAMAGCGDSNPAAVVDGRVITQQAVQQAADQITTAADNGQRVSTASALQVLIAAPAIHQVATAAGKPISDGAARSFFRDLAPNQAAVDIVRASSEASQLGQADGQQVLRKLAAVSISVNPRYGTFDSSALRLNAPAPNWLLPAKLK